MLCCDGRLGSTVVGSGTVVGFGTVASSTVVGK